MSDITDNTAVLGRVLLDEFGRGWSKGKIDVLMGVFADDPVFLETPFSEQLRGREAVRGYWEEVPMNQSEITFSYGEVFAVGPWFSAEFRCIFRRRRTGEWVDARGAMFCETDGTRITEMRMYWHRQ